MPEPRDFILGTAGHIDHGKTALVRALTGVDTDRLPDEKLRGITIDLGFARLDLGSIRLGLVDVPGHERFVRNMLAGASGFDLALLVVAADDSIMPQTREHLEILGHLRVPGGVIALTKCDLADADWLALVEDDVRSLVRGSPLEHAPIVRTSVVDGTGLDELKAALARAAAALPAPDDPGLFRLAVDRAFSLPGHGAVATGTAASGSVSVGDELELWPGGRVVRVRSLSRHSEPATSIERGARAGINLAGVRHTELERGMTLATPGFLADSLRVSARVRVSADSPRPLRHRKRYRLHIGTAEVGATLSLLDGPELRPGADATAQLMLETPVAVVHGQPFVLREESPARTIGGGTILNPIAQRLRRRDLTGRARLAGLASENALDRLEAAVAGDRRSDDPPVHLVRDAGVPLSAVPGLLSQLVEDGRLVELDLPGRRRALRTRDSLAALEDRLLRALARLHARNPRLSAVPRTSLLVELADLRDDGLVNALIDRGAKRGVLLSGARAVARADFQPRLSQSERKLKAELATAIQAGGMSPPDLAAMQGMAGSRASIVPELLNLLVEEGVAVAVSPTLHFDAEFEQEIRRRVIDRLAAGPFAMADLRDLLGTSRKYAVPLAEHLDAIGLTLRQGDLRVAGPAATVAGAAG